MMTPEQYNYSKYARLWALSSLPPAWEGTQLLAQADANHNGVLYDDDLLTVDWLVFSSAVARFQRAQGLGVDGKLGAGTLAALLRAYQHPFNPPQTAGLSPSLALYNTAECQLGVAEFDGAADNPLIARYWQGTTSYGNNTDDEVAWCSAFMNWCALHCGLRRSASAMARSWLGVGIPVSPAEFGDIVIFWRNSPNSASGHVALFHGYDDSGDWVLALGGNQGNRVSVAPYAANRVLGFRRPVFA